MYLLSDGGEVVMVAIKTNPEVFRKFHEALTKGRPEYKPFYFPLNVGEKDPLDEQGWKGEKHRLELDQAIRYLEMGHNVGVAGTDMDGLVIIDIDDEEAFKDHKFIPTLTARSSSRVGRHHFYFTFDPKIKINIALEHKGEIRADWQYVVAPGSWAKLADSKDDDGNTTKTAEDKFNALPDVEKQNAGKYTLEEIISPALITYEDIPVLFKDTKNERDETEKKKQNKPKKEFVPKKDQNKSALFELEIDDVITDIPDKGRHPYT